jgi:hypothetical protein
MGFNATFNNISVIEWSMKIKYEFCNRAPILDVTVPRCFI